MRFSPLALALVAAVMAASWPGTVAALGDGKYPIWTGFTLPEDPGMSEHANEALAKALSERATGFVIAGKSDDPVSDRRRSELIFRRRIAAVGGGTASGAIRFWFVVENAGLRQALVPLTPEEATDEAFDGDLVPTEPDRWVATSLTAVVASKRCSFSTRDGRTVSFRGSPDLARVVERFNVPMLSPPLRYAFGSDALMDFLVSRKIDVDTGRFADLQKYELMDWEPPIVTAARRNDLGAIRRLVEAHADVNATDGHTSALHRAAAEGNVEAAVILLKNGANVNLRVGDGPTPLSVAQAAERKASKQGETDRLQRQVAMIALLKENHGTE